MLYVSVNDILSVLYQVLNKQVPVPVPVHEAQVPVPVVQVPVQVPVLGKQVQVPVPTELVTPNLIFSWLTVWVCRLYKKENLSQNLFAARRNFRRCSS